MTQFWKDVEKEKLAADKNQLDHLWTEVMKPAVSQAIIAAAQRGKSKMTVKMPIVDHEEQYTEYEHKWHDNALEALTKQIRTELTQNQYQNINVSVNHEEDIRISCSWASMLTHVDNDSDSDTDCNSDSEE